MTHCGCLNTEKGNLLSMDSRLFPRRTQFPFGFKIQSICNVLNGAVKGFQVSFLQFNACISVKHGKKTNSAACQFHWPNNRKSSVVKDTGELLYRRSFINSRFLRG